MNWQKATSVYFLKPVGQLGPIKIGVSGDVTTRLDTYTRWSPVPLELLISIPGSMSLERALHDVFAYAHSHLEWFHPVEDLLRGIHALQQGVAVEEAFDLSKKTGSIFHTPRRKARFTPQYKERLSFNQRIARKQHALWRKGIKDFRCSELADHVLSPRVSQIKLTDQERAALNAEIQKMSDLLTSA